MMDVTYSQVIPGVFAEECIRRTDSSMSGYHFHKGLEFLFMLEGERYYFVNQSFFHLQKGMAILINTNQFHKASMISGGSPGHRRFLLQLDTRVLGKCFSFPDFPSVSEFGDTYGGTARFSDEDWLHVLYLIERLKKEMPLQTSESNSLSYMMVMELIAIFIRARKSNEVSGLGEQISVSKVNDNIYERIQSITIFLRNNCCTSLTVDQIAEQFYFSRSYLSHVFKVVTGYTIVEYTMMCRIQKACELLTKTAVSITDIANQTGFGNITYFERVFKRIKGVTPLKYRKQNQAR